MLIYFIVAGTQKASNRVPKNYPYLDSLYVCEILTVRILTDPCSYKVPDGGKALHLLELNHFLFTTKLFRHPRCRLRRSRGEVCTVDIFMMNVLINLLEDIRLGLIIICCFPACDQIVQQGKQKIRALQPNSLYVISCLFFFFF